MISKDREYRMFEVRAQQDTENEMIVEGYALTFNQPTCLLEYDGVKYYEQIDRKALDNADLSDVVMNFNHSGKPVARTRNQTLTLVVDSIGLKIRAMLGGTDEGRKLYEEIKGGYIDKMSFAFIYDKNEYDRSSNTNTITGIKRLYDVSAVDFPAYDTTSINARSLELFSAEAEKVRSEERKAKIDEVKKKILLSKLD